MFVTVVSSRRVSRRAGLVHAFPVGLLTPLSVQAVSVSLVDDVS